MKKNIKPKKILDHPVSKTSSTQRKKCNPSRPSKVKQFNLDVEDYPARTPLINKENNHPNKQNSSKKKPTISNSKPIHFKQRCNFHNKYAEYLV